MYRDLAHLEGEREDQAIRTMHLALYVISAALQTQKVDESMRYLLRAFWNEFQEAASKQLFRQVSDGLSPAQLVEEFNRLYTDMRAKEERQ